MVAVVLVVSVPRTDFLVSVSHPERMNTINSAAPNSVALVIVFDWRSSLVDLSNTNAILIVLLTTLALVAIMLIRGASHLLQSSWKETSVNESGEVALLPWLTLEEPFQFDTYSFARLSSMVPNLTPELQQKLRNIAGSFRQIDGNPVDPVIVWNQSEGTIPNFTTSDSEHLHEAILLLIVAAIGSENYFTYRNPINSSHFEIVHQRFTEGEFTALSLRRRDGSSSDMRKLSDISISKPLGAGNAELPFIERHFLTALTCCHEKKSDALAKRILQSSDAFRRANMLNPLDLIEEDLFWAVTAIEQVLDLERHEKGRHFREQIDQTLQLQGAQSALVSKWAKEVYATRSEVHGEPADSSDWYKWVHALLAVELYPIIVKRLLQSTGQIELSEKDVLREATFPRRVDLMQAQHIEHQVSYPETYPWNEAEKDERYA